MPVTVVCPACSTTLPGVPDALLGKSIKCIGCRQSVKVVPSATAAVPKATALPPVVSPPTPARATPQVAPPPPPPEPVEELIDIDVVVEDTADDVIDVEVLADDPPPPPKPSRPTVVSRRPSKSEEDDEAAPPPPPRRKAAVLADEDEDDSPKSRKAAARATQADDDDAPPTKKGKTDAKEPPRGTRGRDAEAPRVKPTKDTPRGRRDRDDDDEYTPKQKKSAMPLILGLIVGLVVIGGGGAVVAVILTKQPDSAKGTDIDVVRVPPTTTPTPTDPTKPTEPTTTPTAPATTPVATTPATKPAPATTPKPTTPATTPKPPDPPVKPPVNRDRISPEALAKLKKSTVYIEVDDGMGGGGTGSGWFGGEPGLILTNAHVLGMLYPGAKEPAKVSVFISPGMKDQQRSFEGPKVKVLAVDRDKDLAVLQIVNEKDLPPPLPTRPAAQIQELDKLVCLGFPGGRRLAERNRNTDPPTVTVTESAVSAFRNDDFGNMHAVQIQGGVVHGNSGGPVCDLDGNVIGVAVRVDLDANGRLTNIAYAVPVEYVSGLLAGRAAEGEIGQGYVKGDRVVYPVTVRCADALSRLKSVGVGVWIGEKKGGPRPPGDTHTEANGDVGYREIPLVYDKVKKVATGEIDFPRDADGRVYWAQAYFSNALTPKRFLAGNPLTMSDLPVERTAADLSPRFPVGTESTLSVSHSTQVYERQQRDGVETMFRWTLAQSLKAKELVERAKASTMHAQLDAVLDGSDAKVDWQLPNEAKPLPKDLTAAKDALTKVGGLIVVGRDGRATGTTVTQVGLPSTLDGAVKATANRLAQQWAATLAEALIKLPGKSVNAGDTWTDTQPHHFKIRPEQLMADARGGTVVGTVKEELTYTYLGRRDRGGRGEVVVKVDGVLRPVGSDSTTCGSVTGRLVLDQQSGVVLKGDIKREFDLEWQASGSTVRATGVETVKVTREK